MKSKKIDKELEVINTLMEITESLTLRTRRRIYKYLLSKNEEDLIQHGSQDAIYTWSSTKTTTEEAWKTNMLEML